MAERETHPSARPGDLRDLSIRCGVFAVLVVGLSNLLVSPGFHEVVMPPLQNAIAQISGGLLAAFGLEPHVEGQLIRMQGGAVRVTQVCSGLDMWVCLASAFIVLRTPLRQKLLAIAAAFAAVSIVNLLRVVGLASVVGRSPELFDWSHYYFWPGVILVSTVVILISGMQRVTDRAADGSG